MPPALQAHTFLMMAASPEDVSRVKAGALAPGAIQMMRDLEALWGLRFLIRRVEQDGLEAAGSAARRREEEEEEEEEGESEDSDDDGVMLKRQSRPAHAVATVADEFVLSCRGVGVRGHRKAT